MSLIFPFASLPQGGIPCRCWPRLAVGVGRFSGLALGRIQVLAVSIGRVPEKGNDPETLVVSFQTPK